MCRGTQVGKHCCRVSALSLSRYPLNNLHPSIYPIIHPPNQTDRQTQIDRQVYTKRQTDKQTDAQRDRQINREDSKLTETKRCGNVLFLEPKRVLCPV